MNNYTPPPTEPETSVPYGSPQLIKNKDREFLPAALEILETPPPPLPLVMMMTICTFVIIALAWAYFGYIDVDAVAPGKIDTLAQSKIIQPLDSGKVKAVYVKNGIKVQAGMLLLELDSEEALADVATAQNTFFSSQAEIIRRRFAIKKALEIEDKDFVSKSLNTISLHDIPWQLDLPQSFKQRELSVLQGDIIQLFETLGALDKQIIQKQATAQRLKMGIDFEESLIVTDKKRVAMRQEAIKRDVGTLVNLYDAQEALQKSQSSLANDQGQLIENDAAINELLIEKRKTTAQFIADNENKLSEAARKADEAEQSLLKAKAHLAHSKFYAPIDGVVEELAVTTLGQVVTTGQQLAKIAPLDETLKAEALVANLDIGFIKLGQEAVIKIDAFPYTKFGTLHGKVIRIATEALSEQEAKRALANTAASANAVSALTPTSPSGQGESFVFPVTISLDERAMLIGNQSFALSPGMTVTVEIKTDKRRIIEYLLSPLIKLSSEAFKER